MLASFQSQPTAHVQQAGHLLGFGLHLSSQSFTISGDRQLRRRRVAKSSIQATLHTSGAAGNCWCHATMHSCTRPHQTAAWKQASCCSSRATIACCGYAGHSSLSYSTCNSCSAQLHHACSSWHTGKPCRQSACTCRPTYFRTIEARGASLALAEPAAAAATAVASAAAVSTSAFSLSKVVAVVLGYAVLAGSLFRSVPQIMKVLQHQSTEGLSLTSYIVELCCYSITIAYNLSQVSNVPWSW